MTPSRPLLRIAALVPVRGLELAKSRLGEALDAEERRGLVERLLRATIAAAAGVPSIFTIGVVSPDPAALALAALLGAEGLEDPGGGLNAALETGVAWALAAGAEAILVVPGDLPAISTQALRTITDLPAATPFSGRGMIVMVPDRAGTGTNVLLVAPPGAIAFLFGEGSRDAHAAAARTAGLAFLEVAGPLALDLDTPDDLLAAEAAGLVGVLREAAT